MNATENQTHTQGPWRVVRDKWFTHPELVAIVSSDPPVCIVGQERSLRHRDADARLLALAPDLLAALRWLRETAGYAAGQVDEDWNRRNGRDLRDAIDQATSVLEVADNG